MNDSYCNVSSASVNNSMIFLKLGPRGIDNPLSNIKINKQLFNNYDLCLNHWKMGQSPLHMPFCSCLRIFEMHH